MMDDPIKLYVVVMGILLSVLGFVAYASWQQAEAFETAIAEAPRQAERIRQYSAEVKSLCEQLGGKKLRQGYRTLIEQAAGYNSITWSKIERVAKDKPVGGGKGKERRFKVEVNRTANARLMTRDQVAKFCRTVEVDSRGILKTIEVNLRRHTGSSGVVPGKVEEVEGDTYSGSIIFGLRIVN